MNKPKLYIVTGISGSGKTTIARALIEHGEVAFDSKLNVGLYRFVDESGNVAEHPQWDNSDWLKRHKWSLNMPELESLIEQNQSSQRLFLCGRANIYQYWDIAAKVFLLKVDASTLDKRLNSHSRDNLFAKDLATQQKLIQTLDEVQANLIKHGAVVVDAKQDVSAVIRQILDSAT